MINILKFRALKDDMSNCNFVYGHLVYDSSGKPRITEVDKSGYGLTFHTCIENTETQFTFQKDYKGKEIYVGDIISKKWKCEVYQNIEGTFMVKFHTNPKGNRDMSLKRFLEQRTIAGAADEDNIIVGNIFENPEILEAVA